MSPIRAQSRRADRNQREMDRALLSANKALPNNIRPQTRLLARHTRVSLAPQMSCCQQSNPTNHQNEYFCF
jgi:hypothetical protein